MARDRRTADADRVTSTQGSAGFRVPDGAAEWDERYGDASIWSGQPNGALVAEVADLGPGRALDVGCGEGADAVWLARRGWDVTGVDPSRVALDRAARHAEQAGVTVSWVCSGLVGAPLPSGSFDLVSAMYPALRRTPGDDAERALLSLVRPGGVLLVVHHLAGDAGDGEHGEHGEQHLAFDPADYVMPEQLAATLNGGWDVEVNETRARIAPASGAGAHHAADVVLRARRRAEQGNSFE